MSWRNLSTPIKFGTVFAILSIIGSISLFVVQLPLNPPLEIVLGFISLLGFLFQFVFIALMFAGLALAELGVNDLGSMFLIFALVLSGIISAAIWFGIGAVIGTIYHSIKNKER